MYFTHTGRPVHGYGAYGGVWDDTQVWLLENLPTWATGVTPVDVPEGEAGVVALEELAPTLEGKVLLSARAQMALWTILERQATSIDTMFAMTADIGGPTGESIRAHLEGQRQEVIRQANEIIALNNAAFSKGIPAASMGDWFPSEAARTSGAAGAVVQSPPFWGIVLGIVIAAVVLAAAVTIAWAIGKNYELQEQVSALGSLPDPEAKLTYLLQRTTKRSEERQSQFPWGWAIGIATIGVSAVLLVAWAEGTLGRVTERLRSGPTTGKKYPWK